MNNHKGKEPAERRKTWKSIVAGASPCSLISIALVITVVFTAVESFNMVRNYRAYEVTLRTQSRLQQLSIQVLHYNSTTAMAARMAATTGDLSWEERYNIEDRGRTAALRESLRLAPDMHAREALEGVGRLNQAIIVLQRDALALTRQGRLPSARAILFGARHVQFARHYEQAMHQYDVQLQGLMEDRLRSQRSKITSGWRLLALAGMFVAAGWLWVIRTLRRHMQERQARENHLAAVVETLRESETELKKSEERFGYAVRATTDIIWDWTIRTNEVRVAPDFYTTFGLAPVPPERFMELCSSRIHPEDWSALQRSVAATMAGEDCFWRGEYRFLRGDGTYAQVQSRRFIVRDAAGAAIRVVAAMQDISERKEQERRLAEALQAAEAANIAKSEFLANMSHEIRTPLNGIIGMTELALEVPSTSEQADYLQSIDHSAQALLVVINDVLDFSKIEANKLDINAVEMVLPEVVEQAVKTLAVAAHRKGLELNCDIDPRVPECVVGDPFRLRQVLINLIGNAVKFTSAGEVNVHVRQLDGGPQACRVAFSISDTGIGIPVEKQRMIFDKFTQADASTSRVYGGTGLGLAICKALVEMMGGTLRVESSTIQGSTFTFELSLPVGQSIKAVTEPALAGLRTLVVDDNATNRTILVRMLAGWQIETTAACDGAEGLMELRRAAAAGQPYDVLLTDVHMPRLDGFQLVEGLKQDAVLAGTTILMLTSDDQSGDAARCRELGMSLYLVKPVRQSQLKDALRKAIGQSAVVQRKAVAPKPASDGLRILLAEDNPINQKFAVRSLEKLNHQVTVATTGFEALIELENSTFDLVLMDVQMPELDGLEATVAIRSRAADYRTIPIIAMTAHALQGDRERCLAAGMTDYISKPLKIADLKTLIEKHGVGLDIPPCGQTPVCSSSSLRML